MAPEGFYSFLRGNAFDLEHDPIAVIASPLDRHHLMAFFRDRKTLPELVKPLPCFSFMSANKPKTGAITCITSGTFAAVVVAE